jgi:hypothetical protein
VERNGAEGRRNGQFELLLLKFHSETQKKAQTAADCAAGVSEDIWTEFLRN